MDTDLYLKAMFVTDVSYFEENKSEVKQNLPLG